MSSTTRCAFRDRAQCSNTGLKTYFAGTPQELTLCRQCVTSVGISMVVDAALGGADVEVMFKDIMVSLARRRHDQDRVGKKK